MLRLCCDPHGLAVEFEPSSQQGRLDWAWHYGACPLFKGRVEGGLCAKVGGHE